MAYYTFSKSDVKSMPSARKSSLGIRKASDGTYYSTKSNSTKYGGTLVDSKPGSTTTTRTSTRTSSPTRTTSSTPTNGMSGGKYYLNGQEVSVVDYAKAQDFYDPNTAAPTAERLDEIANQGFVTPENKAAYETSKLNPVNQNYMAETYNAQLPKTTLSTNAADLSTAGVDYIAPDVTGSEGDISGATSWMNGQDSWLQQMQLWQQQETERRMAAEEQRQQETQSMWQQLLGNMQSPGEARDEAWGETGMDVAEYFAGQQKQLKEIESLTNEYNAVKASRDQQIAQSYDKMASMSFINNQVAQIRRNAEPLLTQLSADINAKAAVMEAEQGNFAEAQKYVNQAVQDATAENKYRYDMFSAAYELNQDAFERVDKIYTDAYETQMQLAGAAYEQQLAEKEAIGELLLTYPNAGIDIYNDTWESAINKAGLRASTLENIELTGGSGEAYSQEIMSAAMQVLLGRANLGDFTTSRQEDIRNVLWNMDIPDSYQQELNRQGQLSTPLPYYSVSRLLGLGAYQTGTDEGGNPTFGGIPQWEDYLMDIVGPGAGKDSGSTSGLPGYEDF